MRRLSNGIGVVCESVLDREVGPFFQCARLHHVRCNTQRFHEPHSAETNEFPIIIKANVWIISINHILTSYSCQLRSKITRCKFLTCFPRHLRIPLSPTLPFFHIIHSRISNSLCYTPSRNVTLTTRLRMRGVALQCDAKFKSRRAPRVLIVSTKKTHKTRC